MATQAQALPIFVSRERVQEHQVHRFTAWASELGLRPGQWPSTLTTDLGNGQPLYRSHVALSPDGTEVQSVCYSQALGCITLTVFND